MECFLVMHRDDEVPYGFRVFVCVCGRVDGWEMVSGCGKLGGIWLAAWTALHWKTCGEGEDEELATQGTRTILYSTTTLHNSTKRIDKQTNKQLNEWTKEKVI